MTTAARTCGICGSIFMLGHVPTIWCDSCAEGRAKVKGIMEMMSMAPLLDQDRTPRVPTLYLQAPDGEWERIDVFAFTANGMSTVTEDGLGRDYCEAEIPEWQVRFQPARKRAA